MSIRNLLIFLFALLLFTELFGQKKPDKPAWADTTYLRVSLPDTIRDKKIILVEVGQKAIIYLSYKNIMKELVESGNKKFDSLKNYLDSISISRDTIIIDHLSDFDYLVSTELQAGNAVVYYKKLKVCAPVITHRLEKYGLYAFRFFYLPDSRPFFSTLEYSGIIVNGKYFSDRKELGELFNKLSSERKE